MRNKMKTGIIALTSALVAGCSTWQARPFRSAKQARLDVLTSFSTALTNRDYRKAAEYLSAEDREKVLDSAGTLSARTRERFASLKLSTLYRDPSVGISAGKLTGIYSILPMLDETAAPDPAALPNDSETAAPALPAAGPDRDSLRQLREVASRFFNSVKVKNWRRALGYVDETEKTAFEHRDGKLRAGVPQRLSQVDTSSWEAMTLKDGKLTGVVLLLPPDSGPQDSKN